jgi:hypothetical protein
MIKEHPKPLLPFITIYGYAQWVTIKDMTNRTLYYKTYENTIWKKIDLKSFALEPGNPRRSITVASGPTVFTDVSGDLK